MLRTHETGIVTVHIVSVAAWIDHQLFYPIQHNHFLTIHCFYSSSQEQPRSVTFVVSDPEGGQSNIATATIVYNSVDNAPILDLNGPFQPGNDYVTSYTEGETPIPVSIIEFCMFNRILCSFILNCAVLFKLVSRPVLIIVYIERYTY